MHGALDIFCWRWHWRRSSPRAAAQWLRFWQEPPPQVLPPGAGLEQVITAVNRNNSQIQALFSNSATLSGPGYPTLQAHIAYQRPRNFRLRAEPGLPGRRSTWAATINSSGSGSSAASRRRSTSAATTSSPRAGRGR